MDIEEGATAVKARIAASLAVLVVVVSGTALAGDSKEEVEKVTERIEMLEDLLKLDGDFRVRVQAAFSLSKIKDPRVVKILIKGLKDKHPTVRAACASALGKIGAEEAVPALEKALKDPIDSVQDAARSALTLIMKDPKKLAALNAVPDVITDVPFHKVKAVFVVGPLKNKSGSTRKDLEDVFKRLMVERLMDTKIDNAMIVTVKEVPPVVESRLKSGKAKGFYFTGTLVKLNKEWEEKKRFVVNATISIACMRYPEQVLAMTMSASASSSVLKVSYKKSMVPKLEEDAIEGALASLSTTLKKNYPKLASLGGKSTPKKKKKKKKKKK
ncbi:MAG: HEAT repeat domain-containing protein [Deltaproteobacteria bacterium]|nr:HEAT repeat domain-containing protein [Deltaproteobacteria bacterium]